jgi:hypothetical protein
MFQQTERKYKNFRINKRAVRIAATHKNFSQNDIHLILLR